MESGLKFDYYYGVEAEQFSFYRVPRILVKDARFKKLSSDAKLLYGLMLDRMSLSMKNGWLDDENRAYIVYSIDNIMEDLGCSKPTCLKIMKELGCENGIGLIEKKRRGLGKPDIIYVKNFIAAGDDSHDELKKESGEKEASTPCNSTEVKNFYFKKSKDFTSRSKEILPQEVKEFYVRRSKNFTSEGKEILPQEVKDFYPNYTNNNYTDMSYTDINHINQSEQQEDDAIDVIDGAENYIEVIKENLDYDYHVENDKLPYREMFLEIFNMVCDVVCVKRDTIRINGEDYPYQIVRSRFLELDSSHIDYVMQCMGDTTAKIGNIRSYMITVLYNAPLTMKHYYQQKVQHDMCGGG